DLGHAVRDVPEPARVGGSLRLRPGKGTAARPDARVQGRDVMRKRAIFLLVLGLLQISGDVLHVRAIKALGAASAASPAPRVFSAVRGLETYSTRFFIDWRDEEGRKRS